MTPRVFHSIRLLKKVNMKDDHKYLPHHHHYFCCCCCVVNHFKTCTKGLLQRYNLFVKNGLPLGCGGWRSSGQRACLVI